MTTVKILTLMIHKKKSQSNGGMASSPRQLDHSETLALLEEFETHSNWIPYEEQKGKGKGKGRKVSINDPRGGNSGGEGSQEENANNDAESMTTFGQMDAPPPQNEVIVIECPHLTIDELRMITLDVVARRIRRVLRGVYEVEPGEMDVMGFTYCMKDTYSKESVAVVLSVSDDRKAKVRKLDSS
jgi:hypothetical protein